MIEVRFQISEADADVLRRAGKSAAQIGARAVRVAVESQLWNERWDAAEAAGELFEARYMQHFREKSEQFLTAQEAASFLNYGQDEGNLSAIGVFDGGGKKLDWDWVSNDWRDHESN